MKDVAEALMACGYSKRLKSKRLKGNIDALRVSNKSCLMQETTCNLATALVKKTVRESCPKGMLLSTAGFNSPVTD